jgi:hypothetical protein
MIDEFLLLRDAPMYGLADLLVVTGLNLLFHARAIRRGAERDLILGSLSIAVFAGALLGWLDPQASAPWQWLSACAVVVACLESAVPERRYNLKLILQHLPLLVAVLVLAPVIHTAISSAGPALMAIPLLLTASVMEFAFATLLPKQTRLLRGAAATGTAGFVLMVIVALLPCPMRSRFATASLVYGYDKDANKAVYAAQQTQTNSWSQQWVPPAAEQMPLAAFTPSLRLWAQAAAPIFPQPTAEISVNELPPAGEQRQVELRVGSTPEYTCFKLWQTEGQPVRILSVNGQRVEQFIRFSAQLDAVGLQLLSGIRERGIWKFDYCGLTEASLVLRLQLPRGERVRVRTVTQRPSLPMLMTGVKRPRPPQLMPGIESDFTLVAQELTL